MRLLAVLAMFVAALLSLTSTMALQSGQVSNRQTVTVTTNALAMLSLSPGTGDGNAATTARIGPSGALVLDFTRGANDAAGYAFAANRTGSTYKDLIKYRGLFKIKNNSSDILCIKVHVPAADAPDLDGIYIRTAGDTGNGWKVAGTGGLEASCRPNVNPTNEVLVDFWWKIGTGESGVGSTPFIVWVEGKR